MESQLDSKLDTRLCRDAILVCGHKQVLCLIEKTTERESLDESSLPAIE